MKHHPVNRWSRPEHSVVKFNLPGISAISASQSSASEPRQGGPVILSKSSLLSRGFTLLEVMVSMVLIATALVAIFRLQAQNLDFQSESRFMTVARLLAQERLSWIAGNPDGFSEGRSDGDFGEYYPEFRYTQKIRRTGSGRDLYIVSLQIFVDETAPDRAFSVETFMYRVPR